MEAECYQIKSNQIKSNQIKSRNFSYKLVFAAIFFSQSVIAGTTYDYKLTEIFSNGDTFEGIVTFDSALGAVSAVNGYLSDAISSNDHITWLWTFQQNNNSNWPLLSTPDKVDWLMNSIPGDWFGYTSEVIFPFHINGNQISTSLSQASVGSVNSMWSSIEGTSLATSVSLTAVPEPETYTMFALGLLGIAAARKRA